MRFLSTLSAAVCLLSAVSAAPHAHKRQSGKQRVKFTDPTSGNFGVRRTALQWTSQGGVDGNYVEQNSAGDLVFSNIVSGNTTIFVSKASVAPEAQEFDDFSIQGSGEHVLFTTNYQKLYRYSFLADYFVYNVKAKTTVPLVADQAGDIQYAAFAPSGNTIAYVRGNDLFIWKNGTSTRITNDGSPDLFNGVPDWVYEEEVFSNNNVLWFSPDGKSLAFLKTDETGVPTYDIQYYLTNGAATSYPRHLELRYPKVGAKNPTVTFQLLNIDNLAAGPKAIDLGAFPPEELVIGEVAWVTDTHDNVIVRAFNRVQDHAKIVLINTESGSAKITRERDGSDGWLDPVASHGELIYYLPGTGSYLELSDQNGWNHIYKYETVSTAVGAPLTRGQFEVTAILNINAKDRKIYYVTTERHSTERHIYSVQFNGGNKKALVDTTKEGVYTASFSASGGYYILSYNGPDLPWQKLYSTKDTATSIKTVNDNAVLAGRLAAYELPKVSWFEIPHPDGYSFNAMVRLPPGFDANKKYPLLLDPYGGPDSQQTGKTFRQVDWRAYIASDPDLEYIILTVDNRGTSSKGRDFRKVVTKQLGKLEPIDQSFAAKWYSEQNSFVDKNHIAIMGWSYGGYLAAKTVELNAGVFTFAIITAPVSDWKFYDSLYTERYNKLLTSNAAGYAETAVRNVTGFKDIKGGFLIQHGTGDDNVHFQNSAVLVDTLTAGGVGPKNFHTQWFTDATHNINQRGQTTLVWKQMARYLWLEKQRKGDEAVHQFDKREEMGPRGLDIPDDVKEVEYVHL